jgi:hypothetical protein
LTSSKRSHVLPPLLTTESVFIITELILALLLSSDVAELVTKAGLPERVARSIGQGTSHCSIWP